ncbi:MAG: hypothetical protein IJ065_13810 [Eubacterium sp.]|nr:hypothetical protein [Eubacterium sp.]
MIHGLTFKEYIEEEKEKIGEMTKAEKISYFKDYYLKYCILALVGLVLLVWIGIDLGRGFRHTIVTGGVIGVHLDDEGAKYLTDDYMEYLGKGSFSNKIDFAPYIILDDEDYQTYLAFQAQIATNMYNYLITTKKGLAFVAQSECLADLDPILDSELKAEVSDRIFRAKLGESGEEIAAAIDISDTAFVKEYIITGEPVYFIITGKPEDYEAGLNVLKYILLKES